MTDAGGILRYGVSYDPYGNPIEQIVNPVGFGYTGAQTDDNGLVYLHNRYYDPRTGTFITPDPIDGGGAQWNAYAYANGNPINNIDPDGCSAIAIAGGAIALRFAIGFVADAGMQYLTNCGQVDWGQATISGGIAVATGGLDKVGKLGRVGRFAAETLLEAGAFTAYDRARGRNTNFFGNVADSAIGNLIGEGIGYGLGRAGRAIGNSRLMQSMGNSRLGQTQITPYQYHLLHGGSAIGSQGRVRTASRFGAGTGVSLKKRRAWYSDNNDEISIFNFREFNEQLTRDLGWTERIRSHDPDFWLTKAWPRNPDVQLLPSSYFLFEARLQRGVHYPQWVNGVRINGRSRAAHNQVGNEQLHYFLQRNPGAAESLERMYEGVLEHVKPGKRGKFSRKSPPELTWHHYPYREGTLYLMDEYLHDYWSRMREPTLHIQPNNIGGMSIWGNK